MAGAPKTLEALAQLAGIQVDEFKEFKEKDFEDLTVELGIQVTARVKLRAQFRQLVAEQQVTSAQDKFQVFFDRVGGADSLAGLQHVPVSTLPVALSFLSGKPGAPSKEAVRVATVSAHAKADALLASGPDPHSLTRDEIAAVNMYTQDGWQGPQTSLFRPLNAALRSEARTDVKMYWGYIRLLQHALFKLPKDESGVLFRGIKLNWPNAPTLEQYREEMVRKQTQEEEEIWWGFSSTSTSLSAVRAFLGEQGSRVIFTLDGGSSARDVRRYSHFQEGYAVPEDERLLPCGTAFHIKSADIIGEVLMVSLRQTDDILIQGGAPAEEPPLHELEPEPEPAPAPAPQPQPQPKPKPKPKPKLHTTGAAQFAHSALEIKGHPLSVYNGVYRVTSEHKGMPVLENAGGIFCYYYEPSGRWFLWKEFTPDSDTRNAWIEASAGAMLPTGAQTWQYYTTAGEWTDRTLTATLRAAK